MKITLIGGSGFVGYHLGPMLQATGHKVEVVDPRHAYWKVGRRWDRQIGMPGETEFIAECLEGTDVVIHLAGVSNTSQAAADPERAVAVNCLGTTQVLEASNRAGVDRVVIASSTLLSGILVPHDDGATDEFSPADPLVSRHPYVTSKLFSEMIARDYSWCHGLDYTVLRYGIMYGPKMTPGVLVEQFITRGLEGKSLRIHGTGEQWRQYMHVDDMARAHLSVLEKWNTTRNQTYNIAPAEKSSVLGIAEMVQAHTGAEIVHEDPRADDILVRYSSPEKARRELGFTCAYDLESGIKDTIDWYKS